MEEGQNQSDYKIRLNMPATIFIVIQIIFIIFLIISISGLYKPDEITDDDPDRIPVATIDNFASVVSENYPENVKLIEATLFDLILRNSPGEDISTSVNATIRENSIKTVYFEKQNLNYFSAIVDIPEIEQSYWFYSEYSSEEPNQYIDYSKFYRIFCLEDSQEILYPDFNCQDDFGLNGRYELVSNLISYFEFNDFAPIYTYERGFNQIEISPYTFDELAASTKEAYIRQVKDAIDSLGIPPDIFTYNVMNPEEIKYFYPLQ